MTQAVTLAQLGGADTTLPFRNRIINGGMVISQYNGTSSVTPTTNQYTLDRWRSLAGGANSKYSVQQNAGSVTPPAGFTNYFGVTSLSAYSVGSSDYQGLVQKIEGYNVADLGWGSANAKTVTLSFWVRSSLTGTFGGAIGNAGHDRSYPFTYTISSANTWTQISVTIAGDTTGTWLTDNSVGIQVFFGLGVGSTPSGTAGSWASAQYFSATGAVSVVGTNGATWYVTGVQLEIGTAATPFERRPYGMELALCQRYYENITYTGKQYGFLGVGCCQNTTSCETGVYFKVSKRTTPTLVFASGNYYFLYIGTATKAFSTWVQDTNYVNTEIASMYVDSITGVTAGQSGSFRQSNTAGFVAFSAEL